MKSFTDYPIEELGDSPFMMALIRECEVISHQGDNCKVQIGSVEKVIESKYVYTTRNCINPIVQGDIFH